MHGCIRGQNPACPKCQAGYGEFVKNLPPIRKAPVRLDTGKDARLGGERQWARDGRQGVSA
jgi:hypothetical protein